jgi:hypothetical protein
MSLSSKRKKESKKGERERKKEIKKEKKDENKDNPCSHKNFPSPNKERDMF